MPLEGWEGSWQGSGLIECPGQINLGGGGSWLRRRLSSHETNSTSRKRMVSPSAGPPGARCLPMRRDGLHATDVKLTLVERKTSLG